MLLVTIDSLNKVIMQKGMSMIDEWGRNLPMYEEPLRILLEKSAPISQLAQSLLLWLERSWNSWWYRWLRWFEFAIRSADCYIERRHRRQYIGLFGFDQSWSFHSHVIREQCATNQLEITERPNCSISWCGERISFSSLFSAVPGLLARKSSSPEVSPSCACIGSYRNSTSDY